MNQNDYDTLADGLMVGSAPDIKADLSDICDVLVLCAAQYQPPSECWKELDVIHCPMHDDMIPLNNDEIDLIKKTVNQISNALFSGKRVLVTCMAGLNRSAFIASMVLQNITSSSTGEICDLVRQARGPMALSNPYFVQLLYSHF